jgi:hypothetical protein
MIKGIIRGCDTPCEKKGVLRHALKKYELNLANAKYYEQDAKAKLTTYIAEIKKELERLDDVP